MKRYSLTPKNRASGPCCAFHYGATGRAYVVSFNSSAWYAPGYAPSVNRLFGISFGLAPYHSIYIGWRPHDVKQGFIDLFACTCNYGRRRVEKIGSIAINEIYTMAIAVSREKNEYKITIERSSPGFHKLEHIDYFYTHDYFSKRPAPRWGYYLFPRFAGPGMPPQPISIYMKHKR